jgi:hypothetical protein
MMRWELLDWRWYNGGEGKGHVEITIKYLCRERRGNANTLTKAPSKMLPNNIANRYRVREAETEIFVT